MFLEVFFRIEVKDTQAVVENSLKFNYTADSVKDEPP